MKFRLFKTMSTGIIPIVCFLYLASTAHAQYSRDPAWSSDGTKIAFVSVVNEYSQVHVMHPDGSNTTQLTRTDCNNYYPFFSPNGSRIVFMSYPDGNPQICMINSNGSDYHCLTDMSSVNADPHWSTDGSQIIFYSNRDGNNEIYIMDADGTNAIRLTDHPGSDQTPSFSPDGQKIVFVSDRDGNAELYLMDPDGRNIIRLTYDPRSDRVPSWSPDSRKIIWYSREPSEVAGSAQKSWNGAEIYEMYINGSGRKQLTQNLFRDHGPVYSPDGNKILFTSDRTGNREIFLMDLNDGKTTQLTFSN